MPVKSGIVEAAKLVSHGVYVITTNHNARVNGMTAAWVGRASFEPPLVTVAIGKTRFSHDMIRDSGIFAVNVLGPDSIPTGKHFGLVSGKKTDKFTGIEFDVKATGAPILKDALAWLDCKVVSRHDAGDHTLFIGEVLEGGVLRHGVKPLIYDKESFFK